jgi:hypothetical protein
MGEKRKAHFLSRCYLGGFTTVADAQADVFDYMERFHSSCPPSPPMLASSTMRPLELYWLKVALAVGLVAVVLLVLIMGGMAREISHLYAAIEKLVS